MFKLFHISTSIESNTTQISESNERLVTLREEHQAFEEEQKAARKEAQKAQKEAGKKEKEVKKREKDLEASVRAPLRLLEGAELIPHCCRTAPRLALYRRSTRSCGQEAEVSFCQCRSGGA